MFPTAEDSVHIKMDKKPFFMMIFLGYQTWFVWCFLMSNITNTLNIDLLFFIDNIRVERFQFSKAKPKIIIFINT